MNNHTTATEPRGLTRKEAADYCGVGLTCFDLWRKKGLMPVFWPGTKRFDRVAIDAALDKLSGIEQDMTPYDKWKRDRGECA